MTFPAPIFIAVTALAATVCAAPLSLAPEKIQPAIPDRQDVQVADRVHLNGWAGTRMEANESNRLAKLDPDRLLEGYRKRPGRQKWDGEHVGKWLHAATLAWANSGDPALREKLDFVAAELIKCQLPDGYLGTYVESERWTEWDVWAHKYNLIGLITYMRYTGNLAPLQTCTKMADLLCSTFGDEPGKRDIILAGQHMGMAPTSVLEPMVLLYRFTGEPRYLEFCKYILRAWEHPNGPKIVSALLTERRVDKVGNGKAYEMLSCLNGALEYYRTFGDRAILNACLNAWQDIVDHRLYITGTASYREFFHGDFDLPNVSNVGETCVTVTWLQLNAQLLRLTGEARFAEQLEKTVLNQLFGAQCPDGSGWGYYVQMQGKKPYSSVLDGHCCLSSGPRGVALISTFAVTTDADGIVVNLYDSSKASLKLRDGTPVNVTINSRYPAEGKIRLKIAPEEQKAFAVKLRIPAWCQKSSVLVNGRKADLSHGADGYEKVQRKWQKGDEVTLDLNLEPRIVLGDHKNEGRAAILFGPLVLAVDEALIKDGQPLNDIGLREPDLKALQFKEEPAPEKRRTWSGAKVFRINAVERPSEDPGAERPVQVKLAPFADAGASGTAYRIWLPNAPPKPDRNLLMDGVEIRSRKPNAGSILDGDLQTIAATFNNKRADEDWFGAELEEPITVKRVVFAHGKTFHNGGWFDTSKGKPIVQIKLDKEGPWKTAGELRDYPATTPTDAAGLQGGELFSCELAKALRVTAIRVVGKPASGDDSRQAFSSCAELRAFRD